MVREWTNSVTLTVRLGVTFTGNKSCHTGKEIQNFCKGWDGGSPHRKQVTVLSKRWLDLHFVQKSSIFTIKHNYIRPREGQQTVFNYWDHLEENTSQINVKRKHYFSTIWSLFKTSKHCGGDETRVELILFLAQFLGKGQWPC